MADVRIQFDVPEELYDRAKRYIPKDSARHVFGHIAFEEWVNRREGRDRRTITENRRKDKEYIRELVREVVEEINKS